MHNMGHGRNKVLLVHHEQYELTNETLGSIHETLFAQIDPAFHNSVFLPPKKVQLANRQTDTISACNYSAYANELLSTHLTHMATTNATPSKRSRIILTYSSAVSLASTTHSPLSTSGPTITPSTISTLTDKDMDALFERMKPYLESDNSISGVTIEEPDKRMAQSRNEVLSIREGLNSSISDLSTRLETILTRMERQNSIIRGMEGHFRDTFADFSNKIKELYEIIKLTNPSNPSAASTSKQVHWGGVAR
jgi:hypothetical protein